MRPYYQDDAVTLYHGDARMVLPVLSPSCVDLVLTDPPYPKEYDAVWDILAQLAPVAMRDGAFLVTLLGHYQLPRVVSALGKVLEYHWCGTLPNNNQPIMHGFAVKVCWKPVLIYKKGAARPRRIFCDNFLLRPMTQSWRRSQSAHKWGQAEAAMWEPIDAFTEFGQVILDPFVGGGTTLRAAKDMGRRGIGIEIEERSCEVAARRMEQELLPFVPATTKEDQRSLFAAPE